MRIFLTGFMGAGKTTVGRLLAERLGLPFHDLDQEIEERAGGLAVREIFALRGEPEFRRVEKERLEEIARGGGAVVATGGGTVTFEANFETMRHAGLTVWLNPPFATIVSRVGAMGKEDRPLFRDETHALELYRSRLPAYRRCDVEVAISPRESVEEVVARIVLRVRSVTCAT